MNGSREDGPVTAQERENLVVKLSHLLHELILDERNVIQASIDDGLDLDVAHDGVSTIVRPNGTKTMLILINGGARGTVYPKPGSMIHRGTD